MWLNNLMYSLGGDVGARAWAVGVHGLSRYVTLVRAWELLVRGDFSLEGVHLHLCPSSPLPIFTLAHLHSCPSSPSCPFLQSKAFDNADFVVLDLTRFAAKSTG
jgi:hypothetical protein